MTEWKPDNEFLDFLLKEWEKDSGFLVGFPDGTEEGGKGYTPEKLVEAMRTGTELGREVYATAYDFYQLVFQEYKANKQ